MSKTPLLGTVLSSPPTPTLPASVWNHPKSTLMDGKCGTTAVSNMLLLYGIKQSPASIDLSKYRSWGPGMRRDKLAENLNTLSGKKFFSRSLPEGSDPLASLRSHLIAKKPVAVQYMIYDTTSIEAHWIVVVKVESGTNPAVYCITWGGYRSMPWSDLKDRWRRGYGGPYPHVVGQETSSKL